MSSSVISISVDFITFEKKTQQKRTLLSLFFPSRVLEKLFAISVY